MKKSSRNNYRERVLEVLDEYPTGLTITEISEKTGAHRNTVSTHIRSLESESKVIRKEIGSAHLYFSKKREFLNKELVNSFLKALLSALKDMFPQNMLKFKEIGHKILSEFQFPISEAYLEAFKKAREITDPIAQLKLFRDFYNSYDFFQDDLEISIQNLGPSKATFRIINSEYLADNGKYLYFFYIACGITEGVYFNNLDKKVACEVERVKYMSKKEESYIDISLEFIED